MNVRKGLRACRVLQVLFVVLLLCFGWAESVRAQDGGEKEVGWFFEADLAAVWTAGNSESNTFGADGKLRYEWKTATLRLQAGGTQTQSTLKTRTAVGSSPSSYNLQVDERTDKTAELYYARTRYDQNINERFYLLGGVDWFRNTFAGVDSRTLLGLGAGNTWADNGKVKFGTDYAFTYTFQQEVVKNPITKNEFPGVRLGYDLWWKMTTTTEFSSNIAVDWNLDNTDDVRFDFTNSLVVSISEKLQLKPSLQLLWRNDPALTEVDLLDQPPPNGTKIDTVTVPLEKLDSLFTLALVVKL
jgi:putative salt-induced outer membrane protein YdiY